MWNRTVTWSSIFGVAAILTARNLAFPQSSRFDFEPPDDPSSDDLVTSARRANGEPTEGFLAGGVMSYPPPPPAGNERFLLVRATTSPRTDGVEGIDTITSVPVVAEGSPFPTSLDRTVRASVNVVPGSTSDVGLGLRIASTINGTAFGEPAGMRFGYAFALDLTDGELEIFEAHEGIRTQLASGIFTNGTFDPGSPYRLEFTALGTRSTGRVFSAAPGLPEVLLGEVITFDNTRTRGQEALFVGFQDDAPPAGVPDNRTPAEGTWDDFDLLPPIPEPGLGVTLATALGVVTYRRRRRA